MREEYDRFVININELNGKIIRKPFTFRYDEFEILKDDFLILKVNTPGRIRGFLENDNLNVKIMENESAEYLNHSLIFDSISSDIDNIRWELRKSFQLDNSNSNVPDYIALFYMNEILKKISFVFHNIKIQINFFSNKHKGLLKPLSELCLNSRKANIIYEKGNMEEAKPILFRIYNSIKKNPKQLRFVENYENVGRSFLFMLESGITEDIDALQFIVSIGYLCTSLASEDDVENLNLYKDRLLLLYYGHTPFSYTVMDALNLFSGFVFSMTSGLTDLKASDAIYKMELYDLENNPMLCAKADFFQKRKKYLEEMIQDEFFLPVQTKENVMIKGAFNHQTILTYLENKVIENGNIDF